jgi:hypothetical protein
MRPLVVIIFFPVKISELEITLPQNRNTSDGPNEE